MAYELEKEYISKLPANPLTSLVGEPLEQELFKAREALSVYHTRHVTPRIIVLQALYNVESSLSEYEALRRQGVSSMSTKRGSISFESGADGYTGISPQVIEIIGSPPAQIGRFY